MEKNHCTLKAGPQRNAGLISWGIQAWTDQSIEFHGWQDPEEFLTRQGHIAMRSPAQSLINSTREAAGIVMVTTVK